MANRYWVGGSGNWTSTTKWSSTSGGASGASVPTSADDVFIDQNSSAGTFTITVGSNDVNVRNFSAQNLDDFATISINSTFRFFVHGTYYGNSNIYFTGGNTVAAPFFYEQTNSNSTKNITWNGTLFNTEIKFNENTPRGTKWVFQDALTSPLSVRLYSGHIDTNGQNVDVYAWDGISHDAGQLTLGASVINIQTAFDANPNRTTSAASATIRFYGSSSKTFGGADKTYGKLHNAGSGVLNIPIYVGTSDYNLNNTVNALELEPGTTLTTGAVHAGNRFKLNINGPATISGTSGNLVTINTNLAGNYAEFYSNQGYISGDYLSIKDNHAIGPTAWYAGTHSTNVSGNTGWTFTAPPPLVSTISDGFDTFNTSLWDGYNNYSVSGSNLVLTSPALTQVYSGATSDNRYMLYGSQAWVQLVDMGNQSFNNWEAFFLMRVDSTNEVGFFVTQNTIRAYKKVAGTRSDLSNVAYVPATHKFIRLRENGGILYWEYSSNFTTWNIFTSAAPPINLSSLTVEFSAGTWNNTDNSTSVSAKYDNFNISTRSGSISGTILFSGGADRPELDAYRDISGTILFSGSVNGSPLHVQNTFDRKIYSYKIYNPDTHAYLGEWTDVISELNISQEINSGGSAIEVTLARNSDSQFREFDVLADDTSDPFLTDSNNTILAETQTINAIGPGTNVDLNLDVVITAYYDDAPLEGVVVFTGYISRYVTQYGRDENTKVTLFSYGADMDNYVLESGGATRVSYESLDPGMILRNALDVFNADGGIPTYFHNDTALKLKGTGTSHAVSNSAHTLGLTNVNIFTFAAWVYPDSLGSRQTIYGCDNTAGLFQIEVGPTSEASQTNAVYVLINGTGVVVANNSLTAGAWNHIVYVRNGTGNNHTIYVNAVSKTLTAPGAVVNTTNFSSASSIRRIGGRTATSQKFKGKIDELMIFDSALNSTQVTALYNTNTRPATPKLWYKFDENNGFVVANSGSQTGANMTLTNGTFTDDIPANLVALQTETNTVENSNTVVTYAFNTNTILEVVKKCLELSPTDWFWYYDMATNYVHLHPRPSTPAHTFILGKHITELNLEKYIEDLTNVVYFTGGALNPFVQDVFSDIAGTDLSAHVGAIGATWTRHPNANATATYVITDSERVRPSGTGGVENVFIASGQSLSDDYSVHADYYQLSYTADFGIIGRVQPSALTFYMARIQPGSNQVQLYKCVAGSFTSLGTSAYADPGNGTTKHIELRMLANKISVVVAGTVVIDVTDNSIPSGRLSGFRSAAVLTDTTGLHIDNFYTVSDTNAATNIFRKYTDATSISDYRRGLQRVTDQRVKLYESADIIVDSLIDRYKDPRYRSQITISDKVYPIESIKLGELVGFTNFGNFVDDVTMQIVRIDYKPDSLTLSLDTLPPSVPKRLEDLKRNLQQEEQKENPTSPS